MVKKGNNIIEVRSVKKSFRVGDQDIPVLKGVDFDIPENSFLIIFGPSGCGKSTLLHIMLGLEPPTEGYVTLSGLKIDDCTETDVCSAHRKKVIGMVFQRSYWIQALSVVENVGFPLSLLGIPRETIQKKAMKMLDLVHMTDWAGYYPTELSSGQQQRVALARSLISDPEIIVADEPTGNLDFDSGQEVMQLIKDLNKDRGKTIIMVTHDLEYLRYANSAVRMLDGKIVQEYKEKDINKLQKEKEKEKEKTTEEVKK